MFPECVCELQSKIPHRSFIIACKICPYLGVSKNMPLLCVPLNANEHLLCIAVIVFPFKSKRGRSFNSLCFGCNNKGGESHTQPKWRVTRDGHEYSSTWTWQQWSIMKMMITLTLKIYISLFSDWLLRHFGWYLRSDLLVVDATPSRPVK